MDTWTAHGEADPSWSAVGLALGMVAILTGLGVLLGSALDVLVAASWPGFPRGIAASAIAILGFACGWWWFATVGRGWISDDRREAVLEQEDE
jgi:hypothetical protein